MDFDGLLILAGKDADKWKKYQKNLPNLSLAELKKGALDWSSHYYKVYKKYSELKEEDIEGNALLSDLKSTYFSFLARYALYALFMYTAKLEGKHNSMKNPKTGKKSKSQNR